MFVNGLIIMRRTILYLLILFGVTLHSQNVTILFDNYSVKKGSTPHDLLYFRNANYNGDFLPFITKNINGFHEATNIKIEFSDCSNEEIVLLKELNIPSHFELKTNHNYSKKNKVTSFIISPWISKKGLYQKIKKINFDLKKINSSPFNYRKTELITNSKLINNKWFKFSIVNKGVQKITYNELIDLGLISSKITSSKIEILSNTARMLPFINNADCIDDLENIPYQIFDNGDGFFDNNDYILFYAKSNGYEYYDASSDLIKKEINLYTDTNYVFLGFNALSSKLINISSENANSLDTIYNHTKIEHHENEYLNFIKSGKTWVGEKFDNGDLFFKSDYLKPYSENKDFSIQYNVCARSINYTDNIIQLIVNGDTISNSQINNVSSIYYNDYVKFKSDFATGVVENDTLGISFHYKQSSNLSAWLDYFTINSRQRLFFNDDQVNIINKVNDNLTHTFNIKSLKKLNVWDVTDIANVKYLQVSKVDSNYFFNLTLDTVKEIVFFNDNEIFTPIFNSEIQPQNVHGDASVNYLIITTPEFEDEANRLISLHSLKDNLTGKITFTDKIYNEFSCGRPEATAIRNYIKMLYKKGTTSSDSLQYVLLLGDGSYDPKNRLLNNTNHIPTFQSDNSIKLTSSYVTDDIYGLMDDHEGEYKNGDLLDISIGRFPAKTTSQAKTIVDKIYEYYNLYNTSTVFNTYEKDLLNSNGSWKNNILFIGDDEDYNEHMKQADQLSTIVDTTIQKFNIKKIFLDSYTQESSLSGETSPEANKALIKNIHEGALVINYTGHGGELGWTEEEILLIDDIHDLKNRNTLPLFMTATCEFSRFDDPNHTSAGEYLILQKEGGAIALFTTVRLVFSIPNFKLNKTFYSILQESISNQNVKLGDVFRLTKVRNNGGTNDRNFTLLGDPALKLAFPLMNVLIDDIKNNNATTDTLKLLSTPIISGHVENNQGALQTNYTGWAEIKIYDKKREQTTLDNDNAGINFNYKTQEDLLFKGETKITNGKFQIEVIIPKDARSNYDFGKISIYAVDSTGKDAAGFSKKYLIGGLDENYTVDNLGPDLEIFLEDTTFSYGGQVSPSPLFIAQLSDSNGINIMNNDIGKDITLTIDEDFQNTIVLNSKYKTLSSFRTGEIIYSLEKLENGRHSMVLKAFDNQNNSSQAYTEFIIESNPKLALDHLLNYPNPFTTSTGFYFEHNQSTEELNILIQILTISGRIIKTIETTESSSSQRIGPIQWNGRDDFGDPIGRGVYLYNITVENSNGDKINKLQKLVILK
jgi:hypothetical protein